MKYYFLVKKWTPDGTEIMNPEKIRCTLSFGFDPVKGCDVAHAKINSFDAEILIKAVLFAATDVGLYFKGKESSEGTTFNQEWLFAHDENFINEKDSMNKTQSHLFEGM